MLEAAKTTEVQKGKDQKRRENRAGARWVARTERRVSAAFLADNWWNTKRRRVGGTIARRTRKTNVVWSYSSHFLFTTKAQRQTTRIYP